MLAKFPGSFEHLFRSDERLFKHLLVVDGNDELQRIGVEQLIAFFNAGAEAMRMTFFVTPRFYSSHSLDDKHTVTGPVAGRISVPAWIRRLRVLSPNVARQRPPISPDVADHALVREDLKH